MLYFYFDYFVLFSVLSLLVMGGYRRPQSSGQRKASVPQDGASNTYPCGSCGISVVGAESSVACDLCHRWFHGTGACTGLSDILLKEIMKSDGRSIRYCCPSCEDKTVSAPSGENCKQDDNNKQVEL